ncbi:MAG: UDP-N-acetylmuramoyl-L-alanyl-D-glutamate--2,6-diaminopimelate ligase [Xanthomonadaceae bacterium]|nr:UDP-N-acetylmuramoyl-L-alanyl-D-glutamate--2,6-diaminopimelate ligase [Xanthomonadaceae bacterium]
MSTRPAKPRAKNLATLLQGIAPERAPSAHVSDLTLDSRQVEAGGAFVALTGLRTHGLAFLEQALSRGAAAVLWEPAAGVAAPRLPVGVIGVRVPDLTRQLGTIADRFFDAPSSEIRIAAVTGTNGKTTIAYMLAEALEKLGIDAAYTGTLGFGRVGAVRARSHTTPDCITVHRELAELRDDGVRSVAMEVTSHALVQQRVAGVRFDAALFTNLTRDHLDYHGTFEAYGEAKARLFEWPTLKHAIVNLDDPFGATLTQRVRGTALTVYGRESLATTDVSSEACYVRATHVVAEPVGLSIEIDSAWGRGRLHSRLIGAFNVDNVLAVLAALLGFDVPLRDALQTIEQGTAPPGRMEMLIAPGKPLVVVDYAHTPDALDKALRAVRAHSTGKLHCVFGCGGERDVGKRPLMGSIAETQADAVIVTDDNPRGEDGDAIVAAILDGMREPTKAHVQRDRAAAIELAIARAAPGDAVLIAGKGHENYQIVGSTRRHFSDREVALAALGRTS